MSDETDPASSDSRAPADLVVSKIDAESNPPILNYARPDISPARGMMDPVTVATFADSWEANLALGKLQELGIPAALNGENIVAIGGGLYNSIDGGIKLRVPAAEAERALAALPKRVRATIVKCPKCGSADTRQIDFSPGVKIMFLLMLGLPYLFVQKPWACLNCSYVWRPSPKTEVDDEDVDEDEAEEGVVEDEPEGDGRSRSH